MANSFCFFLIQINVPSLGDGGRSGRLDNVPSLTDFRFGNLSLVHFDEHMVKESRKDGEPRFLRKVCEREEGWYGMPIF